MVPSPAFPLKRTTHHPVRIAQARHTREPEACLHGGATTLLGTAAAPASLVLDFGEELVGDLSVAVGTSGASLVELFYGEDLTEALMVRDPFPVPHWYRLPHDRFELTAGAHTLTNRSRRAFRYVHVVAHGPAPVSLTTVAATLEHAAVDEHGWFSCSDALLNDAWAISRRTTRLCLQRYYEDGVKRDGMLWIGDYRVEFLCANALFGEHAVARHSLQLISRCPGENGGLTAAAIRAGGHQHPRRIDYMPGCGDAGGFLDRWVLDNYCADFVAAVWEYGWHTGDLTLAAELRPVVDGVLDYLARVDLAQANCPASFITDTQPGHPDWWGSRSTLAFQLAAAFHAGADLAGLAGQPALAAARRRLAQARIAEATDTFGPPAAAACRDEAAPDATRSWHTHAAAALVGALTPQEVRAVYAVLAADPHVRRPMAGFQEFWVLHAWLRAGLVREALGEMRSYYHHMLKNGATTTWETVDRTLPGIERPATGSKSHCHGWSAGPAYLLPAHVLGVTPASPGFAAVNLCPALGDLAWAEGEVPTPHGSIRVSLDASGTGEVELPPCVTGMLHLPGAAPRALVSGRHAFSSSR